METQGKIGVLRVPQFEALPAEILADEKELTAEQARAIVDQAYKEFMESEKVRRLRKENPEGYLQTGYAVIEPAQ